MPKGVTTPGARLDLLDNHVWLTHAYLVQGWSTTEVAAKAGCAVSTAADAIRGLGIMRRQGRRETALGMSRTPTYGSWASMIRRCSDPSRREWRYYGGRGITVCDRWLGAAGFRNFFADMGERPPGKTLDRIDNDGNYEPGNCQWATPLEQLRNRRDSCVII